MTLREIYDAHFDFVWRTLRRMGVPEPELQDSVQEVFLRVHHHLPQFEGRSSLKTWIFTLCRSVARERRRQAQKTPALLADGVADDELDLHADVARDAERNQQVEKLREILAPLPAEQRNVFILFELEEWTGQEISDALGVPLGTVYTRLDLARKAFRAALVRERARDHRANRRVGGTS